MKRRLTLEQVLALVLVSASAAAAALADPPETLNWWAFGSEGIYRGIAFMATLAVGLVIGTVLLHLWRGALLEKIGPNGVSITTATATRDLKGRLDEVEELTFAGLAGLAQRVDQLDMRLEDLEDLSASG